MNEEQLLTVCRLRRARRCIDGSTALRGVSADDARADSLTVNAAPDAAASSAPRWSRCASSAGNDRRAKRLPGAALRFACADHPLAL